MECLCVAPGNVEEAWFDSVAVFDSDCDDDYQSVPDGMILDISHLIKYISLSTCLMVRNITFRKWMIKYSCHLSDVVSLNGIEGGSISNFTHGGSTDQVQRLGDLPEAARSSNAQIFGSDDHDPHCKRDGSSNEVNQPVFLDEISSVDASSNKDDGLLDNCGILPNNCLPCLASTIPSIEKRRSSSSSPPNARKKAPIKLPFKWKEGHGNNTLCELKYSTIFHSWSSSLFFCTVLKIDNLICTISLMCKCHLWGCTVS